jgi:hypothetical protein
MSSIRRIGRSSTLQRLLDLARVFAGRVLNALLRLARAEGDEAAESAALDADCRERLAQRILSTIHNNSILLCAETGVGKTALLLELRDRLLRIEDSSYRFFPVYIDLSGVSEARFFGTLADRIAEQLGTSDTLRRPNGVPSSVIEYSHRDLARELRLTVKSLGERTPRQVKLVLLVDGIEILDSYHPRTNQRLRGLFMTNLADHMVMVGSAVEINRTWDREGSPWYNFFEEIRPLGCC